MLKVPLNPNQPCRFSWYLLGPRNLISAQPDGPYRLGETIYLVLPYLTCTWISHPLTDEISWCCLLAAEADSRVSSTGVADTSELPGLPACVLRILPLRPSNAGHCCSHGWVLLLVCYYRWTALNCWLGDRKGIPPVKNWMLICWWWWFDWSFA